MSETGNGRDAVELFRKSSLGGQSFRLQYFILEQVALNGIFAFKHPEKAVVVDFNSDEPLYILEALMA